MKLNNHNFYFILLVMCFCTLLLSCCTTTTKVVTEPIVLNNATTAKDSIVLKFRNHITVTVNTDGDTVRIKEKNDIIQYVAKHDTIYKEVPVTVTETIIKNKVPAWCWWCLATLIIIILTIVAIVVLKIVKFFYSI